MAKLTAALHRAIITHESREATYGPDGSTRLGEALAAMFPGGLTLTTPQDFARFHLFQMTVAKANRYAANWSRGGHLDSAHDAGIYALLLEAATEPGDGAAT